MPQRPYQKHIITYQRLVNDILKSTSTTYADTEPRKRQNILNDSLVLSLWTIVALNKVAKDLEIIKSQLP